MKSTTTAKNRPGQLIKSANLFPVVGIGASAGGLDAFKKLLKAIPENSGMAYVLVQHLDPNHESLLPEILQKVTSIPVLEITDDMKVQPNHIYVIPSNKMMVATDGVLLLAPRPAKNKNERNLPIDLFFTSLAEVHQAHAIGVVLSGTASDGTLGLKAIKDHGGITFAQDEESAAYEGMPHSAAEAGVVDFILPPESIPAKLLEITKIIAVPAADEENLPLEDEEVFRQIIALLRIRKGTDFTYYKQTTIRRRILRRMALNKNEEPSAYLKYLRENKSEQDVLYQDMLIPVTAFFRDVKSFDNLCETVFPNIIKNKTAGETIRVWVAGCSTGQEAYSIAMCFKEFLGENQERVQIFATDISQPAIIKARLGIYTKIELAAVSPQRLDEFFTKTNGSYQVNQSVRDMCVFAVHNFLKDPPFGRMDFISCRNVLIYMEPYLQKKALTTFHYSLNPKGFLLLGKSETTGGVPDLFTFAAKSDKLFTRKDGAGRFMHVTSQRSEQILSGADTKPSNEIIRTDFQKTADDIMLRKYTPAGVVVNEVMDIVHFRGNTSRYLEQSPGKPSHNLLTMAKNGLAFELRNILHKSKKEKTSVKKDNIPLQLDGSLNSISIEAIPLPGTVDPYYLILFHDTNSSGNEPSPISNKKTPASKLKKDDNDLRIRQLEQELVQAREDMRSITEDQEAANEELQSANEELLSGSEELQSLNEELETSKEELQSTNEELTVVNQEMISLNEQITASRDYSEAIVATMQGPMLVLDKNLRVKTANKSFYKTFQVNELETEGVLIYDLGNRQWDIPKLRTLLEKILPEKSTFKDFEITHTFSHIGRQTMQINASEIANKNNTEKLILLSIENITERRLLQQKEKEYQERFRSMILQSPVAMGILKDPSHIVEIANRGLLKIMGRTAEQVMNKPIFEELPEVEQQGYKELLDNVYTTGKRFSAKERLTSFMINGKMEDHYLNFFYEPYRELDGTISGVITVVDDVTEQVLSRKKVEDSEQRYNKMLMQSPFAFAVLKGKDMVITLANGSIKQMWGKGNDLEGKTLIEVLPEIKDQIFPALLDEVYTTGIPFYAYETLTRLKRNGQLEDVYFNFVYQPFREADDSISGIAIIAVEVTPEAIAKKKIEESEQRFHNLIYTSPSAIGILYGEDLIITIANEPIIEIWGKGNEIMGKPYFEALPELAEQGYKDVFEHVYRTGIPFTAIETPVYIVQKGVTTQKFYNFILYPQKNIHGEINGIGIIATEVTSQALLNQKIKESEAQFSAMADNIANLAWMAKADGWIYWYNKRWYEYTGTTSEQMEGWGWQSVHDPKQLPLVLKNWQGAIASGQIFEMIFPLKGADGKFRQFLTRVVPVKNKEGKITQWFGTNTDITEQKTFAEQLEVRVEERTFELQQVNEKLVFEIDEKQKRAAELTIANKELESFTYISSHDLQEPLRKIQMFAARVMDTENQTLSADAKTYFLGMQKAASRMQQLILDLLAFSRINTSERKFEKTDLNSIIKEALQDYKEIIEAKHAVIEVREMCEVNIIRFQFRQLMHNLIGNALKFSQSGRAPHIIIQVESITAAALADKNLIAGKQYCHISISDNGIGFEAEYKEKIFEVFQRLHGKENYPGTGIGLSIVKKIIENHNGIITAAGEVNEGARFDIYIPVN